MEYGKNSAVTWTHKINKKMNHSGSLLEKKWFGVETWISEYYLTNVIYTMRKEENSLIVWEFIEYLEPDYSVLAERAEISFTQ